MKRIATAVLAVALLLAATATVAMAQHVKAYKFGPSTSQVSAPNFHPTPGPTAY